MKYLVYKKFLIGIIVQMLIILPGTILGQIQLVSAMINSCGAIEGNQEYLTISNSVDIDPSLVNITYGFGADCTVGNSVVFSMPFPEPNGLINSINTLAGCSAFLIASNPIPAGSNIMIIDIGFDPFAYSGWNSFCGTSTYILFTDLPNPGGNFANAGSVTRYMCVNYNGISLGAYGYTNQAPTFDGTYVIWDEPSIANSIIQ